MPHVVLVTPAGSYRTGDCLAAADALGCDVTVVTDARVAIAGSALVVDLDDAESATSSVLERVRRPIDAVVGTDAAAVVVANAIARRVGLASNPTTALVAAGNKLRQRRALARAGVPQPTFVCVEPGTLVVPQAALSLLPVVVKPVDRTASQGVVRADTQEQLSSAIALLRSLVGDEAPLLVEQFVGGLEVAVDGLLYDGRLHTVATFDKPDTPAGPTFPETLLISPARLPTAVVAEVVDVVRRAAAAIGLRQGPIHAECKVDDAGGVWFIELAARSIGGLCSRVVRPGGVGLEELVWRHALGVPPPGAAASTQASGVLMLPVPAAGRLVGVAGTARARDVPGITDVVITEASGSPVQPLPCGDRYLGFVFAQAATADECERALRTAWSQFDIEIV